MYIDLRPEYSLYLIEVRASIPERIRYIGEVEQ